VVGSRHTSQKIEHALDKIVKKGRIWRSPTIYCRAERRPMLNETPAQLVRHLSDRMDGVIPRSSCWCCAGQVGRAALKQLANLTQSARSHSRALDLEGPAQLMRRSSER
jgi:hypothetical protein